MNKNTQLLCTFTIADNLDKTIENIIGCYVISFDKIYILENTDSPTSLYCTYNIDTTVTFSGNVPTGTISLHRKKQTNTLYTINALNAYIASLNDGIVDKNFIIDWEELKNCLLLTTYNQLRVISTRVKDIINPSTYKK